MTAGREYNMTRTIWFLLTLCTGCQGCAGSMGAIANPLSDDPIDSPQVIYVNRSEGFSRLRLSERNQTVLIPSRYNVVDFAEDESWFVLVDSATNLHIAQGKSEPYQVHDLDKRAGTCRLSPDFTQVACTTHANYDAAQKNWKEDDTVYRIDTQNKKIQIFAATRNDLQTSPNLAWVQSGWGLYVFMNVLDQPPVTQKMVSATGQREAIEIADEPIRIPPQIREMPKTCSETGDRLVLRGQGYFRDEGIDVVTKDEIVQRLVVIEGRERGFHDYMETVPEYFFSRDCKHVIFSYDQHIWAVGTDDKAVWDLGKGTSPFLAP